MLSARKKGENDRLDYDVDFSDWLPTGDTILTATSSVTSTSETVVVDDTVIDSPVVKLWIDGGEAGETATVSTAIVSQGGREKTVCFKLRITEC